MKYAAALALGAALAATPAAAQTVVTSNPAPNGTIIHSAPVVTPSQQWVQTYPAAPQYSAPSQQYSGQSESFFGRLMELERRKNAWLRRTFLGQ